MIRVLEHKEGVISGDDARDILQVFPNLEDRFTQRKSYDEYYFAGVEIEVDIVQLDQLSTMFNVKINWESITLS